jgi:cytochrome c551/c552
MQSYVSSISAKAMLVWEGLGVAKRPKVVVQQLACRMPQRTLVNSVFEGLALAQQGTHTPPRLSSQPSVN